MEVRFRLVLEVNCNRKRRSEALSSPGVFASRFYLFLEYDPKDSDS